MWAPKPKQAIFSFFGNVIAFIGFCKQKLTPEYFRILRNTLELYTFLYINQENLRKTNVFQSQTPKQQDSTRENQKQTKKNT